MAPNKVNEKTCETAMLLNWDCQAVRYYRTKVAKLEVGDFVRLTWRRMPFTRRYTPRWTVELFVVTDGNTTASSVGYRVKDQADEEVSSIFYGAELQKVDQPDSYRIEEILKTQTIRHGGKKILRQMAGISDKFQQLGGRRRHRKLKLNDDAEHNRKRHRRERETCT